MAVQGTEARTRRRFVAPGGRQISGSRQWRGRGVGDLVLRAKLWLRADRVYQGLVFSVSG